MLRLCLAVALAVLIAGCGGSEQPAATGQRTFQPAFHASDFDGRTIDNPWYPLVPGTTFVYRGTKDGELTRELVDVTRDEKQILGVRCTVVHDRVFVSGELAEETNDWYAQDTDGNVWYFGEATAELENGKVTSREGSWEAGVRGAEPGIIMQADPRIGDAYRQEHYPGQAEDHARVVSLSASVIVPAGTYAGVQLTREWTPLEPGVVDRKYYGRGVGLVKEATATGARERLVLLRVTRA